MSETIREELCKHLEAIHYNAEAGRHTGPDITAALKIFDDLMAEREKKVNLDEIFPKEVMEAAFRYVCVWDGDEEATDLSEYSGADSDIENAVLECTHKTMETIPLPHEDVVIAYKREGREIKELARVRVRLGLTVEIVEEK